MQTRIGTLYEKVSSRGVSSYSLELWHDGLNKHRMIRGESVAIVRMKASLQAEEWDQRWQALEERRLQKAQKTASRLQQEENKALAAEQTLEAQRELEGLANILRATLDVDDTLDWDSLKDRTPFPEAKPVWASNLRSPKWLSCLPSLIQQIESTTHR